MAQASWIKRYYRFLVLIGLEPYQLLHTIRTLPVYLHNRHRFNVMLRQHPHLEFPMGRVYPMLSDRTASSGRTSGAYFHQDLLVAQRIFENKPVKHVDIGSRIDGFAAHVASFREIEVIDIRNQPVRIHNISFMQGDFMREDFPMTDYCDSVSCLHALEHFGLGRFGDPLDYDGHLKGFRNLYRILHAVGKCYLSVPIGPQRVEFDAHRVFALDYLLRLFEGVFRVDHFSFVDDSGDLHENVSLTNTEISTNCDCTLGCGIFEMTRL